MQIQMHTYAKIYFSNIYNKIKIQNVLGIFNYVSSKNIIILRK